MKSLHLLKRKLFQKRSFIFEQTSLNFHFEQKEDEFMTQNLNKEQLEEKINLSIIKEYIRKVQVQELENFMEEKTFSYYKKDVTIKLIFFYTKILNKEKINDLFLKTAADIKLLDTDVLNTFLHSYSLFRDFKSFSNILNHLYRELQIPQNLATFRIAFKFYLRQNDQRHASTYLQLIKDYELKTNSKLTTIQEEFLLDKYTKEKTYQKVKELLETVEEKELTKTIRFYDLLVEYIIKSEDLETFTKHKEELDNTLTEVKLRNLEMMMDYKINKNLNYVEKLMKENIELDDKTFVNIFLIYKYERRFVDPFIFDRFMNMERNLTIKSFNYLLDLFLYNKVTDDEKINKILDKIKALKLNYNYHTYKNLLHYYIFDARKSQELIEEINSRSIELPENGVNILIKSIYFHHSYYFYFPIFNRLEQKKLRLTKVNSFNMILKHLYYHHEDSNFFERVVLILHQSKLQWEENTYDIIIQGFIKFQDHPRIKKYILDAQNQGFYMKNKPFIQKYFDSFVKN